MTEKQLIKKIKLLKAVKPSGITLKAIKQDLYLRMTPKNRSIFNMHSLGFYGSLTVILLVLILSVTNLVLPYKLHDAGIYIRVTFASNQYEKARIALSDTINRFETKKLTETNSKEFLSTLAFANLELNKLKLKGETGKYTAGECHQLYKDYLAYLENKEKILSPNNIILISEINSYEEQAEKRLRMYKLL